MDDLTKEFLRESMEGLDRMERCLTDLEQRPKDRELLDEIFRAVHTIKGTTGFLGFSRLEVLAHAGENLLDSLREGRLVATTRVINGLLQLLDALQQILRLIEKTGGEGARLSDEDGALITLLDELNSAEAKPAKSTNAKPSHQEGPPTPIPASTPKLAARTTLAHVAPSTASTISEQTLRVDVEVLNRMMNLVGELVLTRNQLLQIQSPVPHFAELSRRLDCVTADLRETVMQARMQPVGHLFGKFPRMVRDLAQSCGKTIRVEFSGQETGLDKSLLEAIKDPLAHAVRNAIDHGIEDPAHRVLMGKPPEGVIRMQARQHNGSVVIEISDDGQGIPISRVLEKAVERQLITAERAATISERDALRLLFLPGFSTSETVTHLSGRGVGMDVVLANVEQVGGTVELESRPGQGATVRLRVPLTLAIVPALVVRSAGQIFCVPQGALAELVYVPAGDIIGAVEHMGEAELYRLRDKLLPMVRLDRILELQDGESQGPTHGFYLVVLEIDGCCFGLVVDDLMAPEEIVVKPLSAGLREIGLFSGATVLGSGNLAMIMDIAAIAARAGIRRSADEIVGPVLTKPKGSTEELFLVFEDTRPEPRLLRDFARHPGLDIGLDDGQGVKNRTEWKSLPLDRVERIESISARQVEYAGRTPLLRYRGDLLALEDGGAVLTEMNPDASITVLICLRPTGLGASDKGERRVGIVVRSVLDVAPGKMIEGSGRACREQLALVNDRLTVVHEGLIETGVWREIA